MVALEVGGRWSSDAAAFVSDLAWARARSAPALLRAAAANAWRLRWTALLSVAAQTAFAATLCGTEAAAVAGRDGEEPLLSVVTQTVMPVSAPLPLEGVSGMKEPVLQARLSEPRQPIMDSEVQVIQLPGSAVAAAVSSIPFVGQKRVPKPQPGEAVSPKKRSKLQVHRLNLLHELAHTAAAEMCASWRPRCRS